LNLTWHANGVVHPTPRARARGVGGRWRAGTHASPAVTIACRRCTRVRGGRRGGRGASGVRARGRPPGAGSSRRLQHHGKVHRPSLGGGPMTTTNKNKSKAAAPTPATANVGDVHQFKTKSSSARMRSLASASGARLRAYDRVVSLSSAFTRASACEMLS